MAPALEQPHLDVMTHLTSLPPGNLGEYSIIKDIGEGTFGKVKREYVLSVVAAALTRSRQSRSIPSPRQRLRSSSYPRNASTRSTCAPASAARSPTFVSSAIPMLSSCEFRPLSRVAPRFDPFLCPSYEIITTATDIVMVIEYAEGELFNYIVDNGRMSEAAARRIFQQMMCAIDYSHRLKVVHRYVPRSGIPPEHVYPISILLCSNSLHLPPTHHSTRHRDSYRQLVLLSRLGDVHVRARPNFNPHTRPVPISSRLIFFLSS